MIGHVYMPFRGGKFAVVSPDGEIIMEELLRVEAKALVGLIERETLRGPRAAGDAETRLQAP